MQVLFVIFNADSIINFYLNTTILGKKCKLLTLK